VIPKSTSVLLIVALMATSSKTLVADQGSHQTMSEMRQVAIAAVNKAKQVNVVLSVRRDGKKKLSGVPSNVSEQGLSLTDNRSGQVSELDFDDIREIRMKGSHVWLVVGIGAAAGLAIALLLAWQAAASRS
jgi:hypothetical protein